MSMKTWFWTIFIFVFLLCGSWVVRGEDAFMEQHTQEIVNNTEMDLELQKTKEQVSILERIVINQERALLVMSATNKELGNGLSKTRGAAIMQNTRYRALIATLSDLYLINNTLKVMYQALNN